MSYYVMRNVRCKTCNKVIAHLTNDYKALIENGYTIGEAMTLVGLKKYCCRKEMMCPFRIRFNMENRAAIDGLITVDEIPIKMQAERVPNHPLLKSKGKKFELESGKTRDKSKISKEEPKKNKKESNKNDFFDNIEEDEVVSEILERDIIIPTYIGVPTYNYSEFNDVYLKAGEGYDVKVISGRTYLAN